MSKIRKNIFVFFYMNIKMEQGFDQFQQNIVVAESKLSNANKWQISFVVGLLFLLVSSPFLYRYVNMVTSAVADFGIATVGGTPNVWGMLLHSLVFVFLIRGLMELPFLRSRM